MQQQQDQELCKCGLPTVIRTVVNKANTANFGRAYRACPRTDAGKCNCFHWLDGKPSNAVTNRKPYQPYRQAQPQQQQQQPPDDDIVDSQNESSPVVKPPPVEPPWAPKKRTPTYDEITGKPPLKRQNATLNIREYNQQKEQQAEAAVVAISDLQFKTLINALQSCTSSLDALNVTITDSNMCNEKLSHALSDYIEVNAKPTTPQSAPQQQQQTQTQTQQQQPPTKPYGLDLP